MRTTVPNNERASIPACGIAVMAKASKPGRTKTRLVPPLTFDGGRRLQHRVSARRRRQYSCRRISRVDRRLHGVRAAAIGAVLSAVHAARDRADRGLVPGFRRLSVCGDCAALGARPSQRRRAQLRQPDAADGSPGRNRGRAGAAGRPGGARTRRRRRLLPARREARRTGACSRTSPGAPSTWRARRSSVRPRSGSHVHVLPTWYDVDDAGALRMLHAELLQGSGSFDEPFAPTWRAHTQRPDGIAARTTATWRPDRPARA